MARPFRPEPDESGSLQPPRRNPPTAVGLATPPPRRPYRPGNYRRFRSRVPLVAYSLLAGTLAGSALIALSMSSLWGAVLGISCLGTATGIAIRIRRERKALRAAVTAATHARAA